MNFSEVIHEFMTGHSKLKVKMSVVNLYKKKYIFTTVKSIE